MVTFNYYHGSNYNNGNDTWNKVDSSKIELDKYKRLCLQLEKTTKDWIESYLI